MATTILDTSSLIALALAQRDGHYSGDAYGFWKAHREIDQAIEAFVLYDDLLLDEASVQRNALGLPQLEQLSRVGRPVGGAGSVAEKRAYELVLQSYLPVYGRDFAEAAIANVVDSSSLGLFEVAGHGQYHSSFRNVAAELTDEGRHAMEVAGYYVHEAIRDMGQRAPQCDLKVQAALIMRTFYYLCLQQEARSDLVLHPQKGRIVERIRHEATNNLSVDQQIGQQGSAVLNRFDESVRRSFYDRKARWLGYEDRAFEIPLLTAYVLKKCKRWENLLEVIADVRERGEARQFRASLARLVAATRAHENEEVDKVLAELDAAVETWSASLKQQPLRKKITVGLPIPGVLQTDIDFPDKKLTKSHADGLLVFVHSLLAGA